MAASRTTVPVTDDDVRAAAEGADEWAEYAAQFGLELTYHIHTNLLVDSIDHWKLYMDNLRAAKLCIDVSHAQLWGMTRRVAAGFSRATELCASAGLGHHHPPRGRLLRSAMVPGRRARQRRFSGHSGSFWTKSATTVG